MKACPCDDVAAAGSHHERRHLAVRDFLRAHPDQARGYERVKRAAAARHPGDRPGYMAAKQAFVDDLERRALVWVRPAAVSRMTGLPATSPARRGRDDHAAGP